MHARYIGLSGEIITQSGYITTLNSIIATQSCEITVPQAACLLARGMSVHVAIPSSCHLHHQSVLERVFARLTPDLLAGECKP
jgi:hypothetical protein